MHNYRRILDSEQWKQINLPPVFQKLIDKFYRQGKLRNVGKTYGEENIDDDEMVKNVNGSVHEKDYVIYNGEKFIVVGFVLLNI